MYKSSHGKALFWSGKVMEIDFSKVVGAMPLYHVFYTIIYYSQRENYIISLLKISYQPFFLAVAVRICSESLVMHGSQILFPFNFCSVQIDA